jgi:hypothetical protein
MDAETSAALAALELRGEGGAVIVEWRLKSGARLRVARIARTLTGRWGRPQIRPDCARLLALCLRLSGPDWTRWLDLAAASSGTVNGHQVRLRPLDGGSLVPTPPTPPHLTLVKND